MDSYDRLYNSADIAMIIDSINEVLSKAKTVKLVACHGRYHAMFVVEAAEHILKSLSYDSKTIVLGKTAALLHDIGNIAGRWNHARKSAALAAVFSDGLENLSSDEKNTIIQAIEDHSDGKNISSAAGAALLIADKADISKRRILPVETIDAWHGNLLEIESTNICVSNRVISMNFIATEAFSKNLLISGYKKGFNTIMRAAEYMGCTCHFQFNGVEERID